MSIATENPVFDTDEFCEAHRISRSSLFKLWREGDGPRIMKVGRRTLISAEAAAEWRKLMESRAMSENGGAK
ncbi:hypothetical protein [Pseudoduganella sp. OTU4001]|uniref:hypothetical protein n=1 Tax=Pseudoduganella sp. OTU4001 TaxID=3043854 RepID=UPI00313EB3BB